ncbi:hypothetical protein JCM33374_g6643 [Metschnikowia sp. JCM 33374]|nr:hypothetical protein JCM33374_g6643 [Metschnikowia sp. JCM 33374]
MENDFCSFMGGNPHISRPWHSSQNLPLIPQLGSSDLFPKPLTTDLLDPYVSGTGAIPIAPRTDLVESVPLPNPTEYHSSPLLVASVHAEPRVPPALPSHASFQESRPNIAE